VSRHGSPRPLAATLQDVRRRAQPLTLLAAVQGAWPNAAGPAVAAQAQPVSEREGVVTVACRSAAWAQELDLLQPDLLSRLVEELGEGAPDGGLPALRGLRFTADGPRHFSA
jgi:predicted nucleic acid-binding Zn ribbon protein